MSFTQKASELSLLTPTLLSPVEVFGQLGSKGKTLSAPTYAEQMESRSPFRFRLKPSPQGTRHYI